ncbi:MAG: LytTR family DNA-binding domain-containing protein [Saprospiraceae bacterium]|nr:LytTR family DNA-binding domain-containing protein [Saprospiraceae bacterium]
MISVVIIDDEKKSRDTLHGLLNKFCPNVTILGQADGYKSGVEEIKIRKPDAVFLDIQMPDGSGFKVLEEFEVINFEVIFTTAYDQFAIKAIKYSALDYLLKPIIPEELVDAVEKVEQKKLKGNINSNIKVLLENVKIGNQEPKKIVLSTSEGMHIIDVKDIVRCQSDDYYTRFFLTNDKMILISKTLKENEELLKGHNFLRPHKSHLINTSFIKSYVKSDGGYIIMKNGNKIPVSRRKRELVLETINNL